MLNTQRIGGVQVAALSRAPVNAIDGALIERLDQLLGALSADPQISVLLIRSGQKAFCAGADLALMQSCFDSEQGIESMVELVRRMQRLFERLEETSIVSIAEIGGAALGGGLELALTCDLRVAAADAKLGLPEAGLGLLPAAGGTQRLTRLCGGGIAKRLILGAELIDGAEAERVGLVQWVQPRERLAAWTRELSARIAAMPRTALAASKRCIHAANDAARDGFAEEIDATRQLYGQAETRERVAEFLTQRAKRSPTKEMS